MNYLLQNIYEMSWNKEENIPRYFVEADKENSVNNIFWMARESESKEE